MQNTFNSVVNFFRVQENQSPDKPEESLSHQENVGDNPPETMNGSPTDKDNPAVNSKDTPHFIIFKKFMSHVTYTRLK